jgi:hypothetical protein
MYVPPRRAENRYEVYVGCRGKQLAFFEGGNPQGRTGKQQSVAGRRPRITRVTMDLALSLSLDCILMPQPGSEIHLIADGRRLRPRRTILENFYEGDNGKERPLNKFEMLDAFPQHDANAILSSYGRICAVDTNACRHPSGKLLSVTFASSGRLLRSDDGTSSFEIIRDFAFYRLDDGDSHEVIGWAKAIEIIDMLSRMSNERLGLRTGLVVDADLENLESYNQRSKPLRADMYLPPHMSLIYASDRGGGDQYVVNHLIRKCHGYASCLMRALQGRPTEQVERSASQLRIWDHRPHRASLAPSTE